MHVAGIVASLIASSETSGEEPNAIAQLMLPMLLVLGVGYMFWRTSRTRRKEHLAQAEFRAAIGVGDEVITTGGIYGFITGADEKFFWLEIDEDVQIRVLKQSITSKVPEASAIAPDEAAS